MLKIVLSPLSLALIPSLLLSSPLFDELLAEVSFIYQTLCLSVSAALMSVKVSVKSAPVIALKHFDSVIHTSDRILDKSNSISCHSRPLRINSKCNWLTFYRFTESLYCVTFICTTTSLLSRTQADQLSGSVFLADHCLWQTVNISGRSIWGTQMLHNM